jgi:hypothetical protein
MNKLLLATAAFAAVATASPASASTFALDGALPMYPHATADSRETVPASALAHGVPYVLLTSDSVHVVDAWYAAHAPKSCARNAQSGGVQYKCPGGSIMIYVHGSTQIALVPAMPHF